MKLKEKKDVKTKEVSKNNEDLRIVTSRKDHSIDPKEKKLRPRDSNHKDSVFVFGAEAQKPVSDQVKPKEKEKLAKYVKCDLCDYKCEKRPTLNKHINSKHTEQKCKVCSKDFKTSMQLVNHVAQMHNHQEESSTPKEESNNQNYSFEFSESVLAEDLKLVTGS